MTFTSVQGLRFIAALMVLFFHLGVYYSGYKGVDLFFVISGFVIYYSTHSAIVKNKSLQRTRFVINRFSKIFLLYWTSLILLYFVAPYPLDVTTPGSFLLLPGHKNILGVSWSLSYELYFYCLCFIFFFMLDEKKANLFIWMLFIVSFVLTAAQFTNWSLKGHWLNFFIGQHLWEFLLGVMAAEIFLRQQKIAVLPFAALLIASLSLLIIISMKYNSAGSYLLYGSLSFLVVLTVVHIERQFAFPPLVSKIVNMLGDASYAMYLFSPIIVTVLHTFHLSKIFIVLIVIVFSCCIHLFYEAPLLQYIRRKVIKRLNK